MLHQHQYDAAIISAGYAQLYFDDDQHTPFHANPYFLQWTVADDSEYCVVIVDHHEPLKLYWYSPIEFWYLPSSPPGWLFESFECSVYTTVSDLEKACLKQVQQYRNIAFIGPTPSTYLSATSVKEPSDDFLHQLAYSRAYKSPFEVEQICDATKIAVAGHRAAFRSFHQEKSELAIHLDYLAASQQSHNELPYPSIVGLNEHGSTLHYQHYEKSPPVQHRSLLIDAGARHFCYHSDITRTYSKQPNSEFAELIDSLDKHQQRIINKIGDLKNFVELHEFAHQAVAEVLTENKLILCSAQSAVDQKLTDVFYPHGTGHLLGLQTHDLGGHIVDKHGTTGKPPTRFPTLRLIRDIEPNMVFTVEPGIYFIPLLLGQIQNHKDVNWPKVERLIGYGGVRIEDNVCVTTSGVQNMTRDAFDD